MHYILRFLWNATRGHRLAPWRSPYLRWRIETYTGIKMQSIGFLEFFGFTAIRAENPTSCQSSPVICKRKHRTTGGQTHAKLFAPGTTPTELKSFSHALADAIGLHRVTWQNENQS